MGAGGGSGVRRLEVDVTVLFALKLLVAVVGVLCCGAVVEWVVVVLIIAAAK